MHTLPFRIPPRIMPRLHIRRSRHNKTHEYSERPQYKNACYFVSVRLSMVYSTVLHVYTSHVISYIMQAAKLASDTKPFSIKHSTEPRD